MSGKGLERVTLPIPGQDFSPQDEAQLRRSIDQFMATADGRVREMDEDVSDLDARVAALEAEPDPVSAVELIETQNPAAVAVVDITLPPGYDAFKLLISGLLPATDAVDAWIRFSNDGGSTFRTGAADYHWTHSGTGNGNSLDDGAVDDSKIPISSILRPIGNSAGKEYFSEVSIQRPHDTGLRTTIRVSAAYPRGDFARMAEIHGAGQVVTDEANDVLRVLFESGNVASGRFSLYGINS